MLLGLTAFVPGGDEPPVSSGATEAGAKGPPSTDAFLDRLWTVTDMVLKHHVEPPSRQEMFLAGTRALLKEAKAVASPDLGRQVSELTTKDQFVTFVKGLWPKAGAGTPLKEEQLQVAMLEGLLHSVPGPAQLHPVQETKVQDQLSHNRYIGIGIAVAFNAQEKLVEIKNPFHRGPAARAGMKPGDLIVEVNGQSTKGHPLPKVIEMLRGEEGTSLTVAVRQPGETATRTLKMTRTVIPIDSVMGYHRDAEENWQFRINAEEPIAYLAISTITSSTLHELRQIERQVRADGCKALVIDLRFNPGGLLTQAALVADGLLDGGDLWRVRGRDNAVKEYKADRDCMFRGWPVVVLVSENTHSAAELITAAWQDNGRAVIVGERTSGVGGVNSALPLPDGKAVLVVRTARTERAKAGREFPIQPDQVVPLTPEQRKAVAEWAARKAQSSPASAAKNNPAPEDPQMTRALTVLRESLKKAGASKK